MASFPKWCTPKSVADRLRPAYGEDLWIHALELGPSAGVWSTFIGWSLGLLGVLCRGGESLSRRSANACIHDRMPVMLPEGDEEKWLSSQTDPGRFLDEAEPYPADDMEAYPVSRLVNSARNNSPELIRPL